MTIKYKGRFRLGLVAAARGATGMAHQVFFNNDKRPELVVTDGKMLAVIPVDVVEGAPESKSMRVSGDAWKLATSDQKPNEEREITLTGEKVLVRDDKGRQVVSVMNGKLPDRPFPKYEGVIPEPKGQQIAVAVDPVAMHKLARVLGADGRITLHMDADPKNGVVNGPIRVTAEPWEDNDQPHGVLMPMAIEKDRRGKSIVLEGSKK